MSEKSNISGKTLSIIQIAVFVLIAGLGGAYYWFMYRPEQEAKEKARLEQVAKEEAEKKARELAEQNKAKYEKMITDADAAFQQENWGTAQSLYSQASDLLADQEYPKTQLQLVNAKLDEQAVREARKVAGVVETVSTRTGRYYVLVSSSIDDDLAMDYSKKLAEDGNDVKIIQHDAEDLPFFGVSVGDYQTRQEAESAALAYGALGSGVWVLKF